MSTSKLTYCFVVIAYCFAPSRQNSTHDACQNGDVTCTTLHHPPSQMPFQNPYLPTRGMDMSQMFTRSMSNNTSPGMTIMTMDKSRTGYYPNANGYGYHNIGQLSMPIPHYPVGWPYPTFQGRIMSGVQLKAAEEGNNFNPRSFDHFKPSPFYSQYQSTIPQLHSMYPPQTYQYSTPFVSSGFDHYSGYPAYLPISRSANDADKLGPFATDKRVPSMAPKFFLVNRIPSGSERRIAGSRMIQPILPWSTNYLPIGEPNEFRNPVKSEVKDTSFKVVPSSFGYAPLKLLQEREAFFYKSNINRHDQKMNGYSHVPSPGIPHTRLVPVSQLYQTVTVPKSSPAILLPKNFVGAIFSSRHDSGRHII